MFLLTFFCLNAEISLIKLRAVPILLFKHMLAKPGGDRNLLAREQASVRQVRVELGSLIRNA